jgi:nicotinamidase-related amidase
MTEYCLPEKENVALITISAQRDFVRGESPLCANGHSRAVPALKLVVEAFRRQGAPIFHSVRLYRADGSNAEPCRRSAFEEGLRILMPGTSGAELIDEIKTDPALRLDPQLLLSGKMQELGENEFVFYRPRWGAFHHSRLEAELAARGINTVVICGFSFSTGTRATIYEASARDLRIILVPDAVCNGTEAGIAELGRIGVYLMSSDYCIEWIEARTPRAAA